MTELHVLHDKKKKINTKGKIVFRLDSNMDPAFTVLHIAELNSIQNLSSIFR